MTQPITDDEARAALATVERGRWQVIKEIDMPRWYWWSVALGWVGLAVVTDLGFAWLTLGATLLFGAVHASMFSAVSAGRHRTSRLRVRAETAGWFAPVAVIGFMVGLGIVTVVGALLAHADHAEHPVTVASVPVAVAIVLGGPALMATIRRASRSLPVV